MPVAELLASQLYIKVDGAEVSKSTMEQLIEVVVEQHSYLPGMFTIRLYDTGLELLDSGPFDLTKSIELVAETPSGTRVSLIKGEITALEPQFDEGLNAELLVRGFDKSHRLYRESKSKAFLNIKDSDLASQFASAAGLGSQIDTTSTVYEHIYQDNLSDLAFLMQRAWRIGYECYVDDNTLNFRKPPTGSAALTLEWGKELISFQPRMTLAEQVSEVTVKGWDPEEQKAIVGQATTGNLYPSIGESKKGAAWASSFGTGKVTIVDHPVVSQSEANIFAQARLDELSGTFVQAEGTAYRSPGIKPGKTIKLDKLGNRFSGTYLVTAASHIYNIDGFVTSFTVRGLRTGSLVEQMNRMEPQQRWPGVVTAVVTNNNDPKKWGRVKVKFPWMAEDQESAWARVVAVGAGPEAGFFAMPGVNDEVLVAFEHGDFNYPYVVGGVWSTNNKLPAEGEAAANDERELVRSWHSRAGHFIAMHDNADKKIELQTAAGHILIFDDANKLIEIQSTGGHKITIDDQGKKLEIVSSGGHKVTLDDQGSKVAIESGGNMQIKATGNLQLEAGGNMDIKASGPVNIKGAVVNLN